MLLDVEQRDKEIIVSYHNTEGTVSFKRYPIEQYKNWYVTQESDRYKHPTLRNWDGRPIKEGPARQYSKFSLISFLDNLPAEIDSAIAEVHTEYDSEIN